MSYREQIVEVMQKASYEGLGYYLDGYVSRSELLKLPESNFKTAILKAFDGIQEIHKALDEMGIEGEEYEL